MPTLLTGPTDAKTIDIVAEEAQGYGQDVGPSESLAEALEILKSVTGKANQEHVARASELVEAAKGWYDDHVIREPDAARA